MDIESIRILNKIIRDKIEETPTKINGWTVGDWDEYIEKKVLEEPRLDIEEVNKTIIEHLLEFLGTSPITSQYCYKIKKHYIYNDKEMKWYFLSEEEAQEAQREWKIKEIININLEINNYQHHEWSLKKWVGHIQEKTGEEPGYLSKIIQEHLGTDWDETLYVSTIDRNYCYNPQTERWQFEGEEEWIEIISQLYPEK